MPCVQDIIAGSQEVAKVFSRTSVLVLDEADRLLEPSFEGACPSIVSSHAARPDPRALTLCGTAVRPPSTLRDGKAVCMVMLAAVRCWASKGVPKAERLCAMPGELAVIMRALPEKRQTLLFSATMTQGLVAMQQHALPQAHCFQVRHRRIGVIVSRAFHARLCMQRQEVQLQCI